MFGNPWDFFSGLFVLGLLLVRVSILWGKWAYAKGERVRLDLEFAGVLLKALNLFQAFI